MFTIAKIARTTASGGKNYATDYLEQGDYYTENERVVGQWRGKLAAELGLRGRVDTKVLASALEGRSPDGSQLTQRQTKVAAYDFQFSSPKSVSIMALHDPRIVEAHKRAVDFAIAELERFAARKVQGGGRALELEQTGNVAAAIYHHDYSRALDPQLHSHCVVLNATRSSSGQRYALENEEIHARLRFLGRAAENHLAHQLRSLGYEIEPTKDGWRIAGVTEQDEKRLSSRSDDRDAAKASELARRRAILQEWRAAGERGNLREWLAARGERWDNLDGKLSRQEVAALVRETRQAKLIPSTQSEIRDRAFQKLGAERSAELAQLANRAMSRGPREPEMLDATDVGVAVTRALDHHFERHSAVRREEILADALAAHAGRIDGAALERAVRERTVGLAQGYVTTEETLERERFVVATVNGGIGVRKAMVEERRVRTDNAIARGVLASRDAVTVVSGRAGTGKTTAMRELDRELRRSGKEVIYLAPTGTFAQSLQRDGLEADTLQGFNRKAITGKIERHPSVICLDESGLAGMSDGAALLDYAKRNGARVVLFGDVRQHSSVPAGEFLRLVEEHSNAKPIEMGEIRRQTVQAYRDAVRDLSRGNTERGWQKLDAMGAIHESEDYLARAADRYAEMHQRHGGSVVASCPTRREAEELSRAIRERMLSEEERERSKTFQVFHSSQRTREQDRRAKNFAEGDALKISTDLGGHDFGTVLEVHTKQNCLTVELDDGRKRVLPLGKGEGAVVVERGEWRELEVSKGDKLLFEMPCKSAGIRNGMVVDVKDVRGDCIVTSGGGRVELSQIRAVSSGWATTTNRAQGASVRACVYAGERATAESGYVGVSRGKEEVAVFTSDKAELVDTMLSRKTRHNALDLQPAPDHRRVALSAKLEKRLAPDRWEPKGKRAEEEPEKRPERVKDRAQERPQGEEKPLARGEEPLAGREQAARREQVAAETARKLAEREPVSRQRPEPEQAGKEVKESEAERQARARKEAEEKLREFVRGRGRERSAEVKTPEEIAAEKRLREEMAKGYKPRQEQQRTLEVEAAEKKLREEMARRNPRRMAESARRHAPIAPTPAQEQGQRREQRRGQEQERKQQGRGMEL